MQPRRLEQSEKPATDCQRKAALSGCFRRVTHDEGHEEQGKDGKVGDVSDESWAWIEQGQIDHAAEILTCLCWDPACKVAGRPRFPILSLPMAAECSKWEMMMILGEMMEHSGLKFINIITILLKVVQIFRSVIIVQHVPRAQKSQYFEYL